LVDMGRATVVARPNFFSAGYRYITIKAHKYFPFNKRLQKISQ
jgi:hypothetical protein